MAYTINKLLTFFYVNAFDKTNLSSHLTPFFTEVLFPGKCAQSEAYSQVSTGLIPVHSFAVFAFSAYTAFQTKMDIRQLLFASCYEMPLVTA